MSKIFVGRKFQRIKKVLSKKSECYVLIICSKPSKEGKMEVELSYDGDENLAAYLVDTACSIFDDRCEDLEDNFICEQKL